MEAPHCFCWENRLGHWLFATLDDPGGAEQGDDASEGVSGGEGKVKTVGATGVGDIRPQDEARHHKGHKDAREQGNPRALALTHEPNGTGHEGGGREDLVTPRKVLPQPFKARGIAITPPKE